MSSTSCKEGRVNGARASAARIASGTDGQLGGFDAKRLGFRILLGWHYCVLFAPLFALDETEGFAQTLVARQFTMYLALACTFAVLFFLVRRGGRVKAALTSPSLTITACIVGAASTFVAGSAFGWGEGVYLVATAVLGACEALLMTMWLLMFTVLVKRQSYRILGTDVVTGALVAMLVQSLVSPADLVVASCLPLLSSVSFLTLKRKYDMRAVEAAADTTASAPAETQTQEQEPGVAGKRGKSNTVAGYLVRRCAPAALFALAFGILQGSFLTDGIAFLIAFNPLLFVGVAVAGLIIFFTSERFCTHADVDWMYRFSLVFFMLGVILLIVMEVADAQQGSQVRAACLVVADIAVFAGFNLFDFGNMMLCLGIVHTYRGRHSHLVVAGRLVVYAFMALGVGAGFALQMLVGSALSVNTLIITCCATLIVLILTVALTMSTEESYVKLLTVAGKGTAAQHGAEFEHIDPCEFCTSAPDCSMRPMVEGQVKDGAGARPASDAIPASDALCGASTREAGGDAAKTGIDEAIGEAKPETRAGASSEASQGKKKAPWRAACDEIARRYRLSKRETEIFTLISKGRNAEYVSTELVISIHTAKTHIANIYQKLDVHSSQEMLDLIDAFRAELEQEEGRAA